MERKNIAPGVRLFTHNTAQFKNAVVSLNITAPLDGDTSARALLIHTLARTSMNYPTVYEMNRRLASLYGAGLSASVKKIGEAQVLSLVLVCLDDRFALKGESVLSEGVDLLVNAFLKPDITPTGFKEENITREKRLLIEKIDSERDDKRVYALTRMTEEMCRDEFYGTDRLGDKDTISALDGKELFRVWKNMLFNCPIQINVTGNFDKAETEKLFTDRFNAIGRKAENITEVRTEFISEAYESRTVTEKQKIKQGKLVIGMRAGMTYEGDNFPALKIMTAIFGSGTFSKLFMNVREKMSLCYYCSARLIDSKGIITVESGVETENANKALEAIRNELDAVRRGDFTDEIIEQAKLSITDSYKSFSDSVLYIDMWATMQCNKPDFRSPEDYAAMMKDVSREEIIVAANMVTEDTVFILESEAE
ncbi:MAG: insulinase family protein [Clostridia bacterium]|nr:insulinase family protein [Clostridia bacterium]